MSIRVRPATIADARALSRFAAETFRDTFERDNTPEDMAQYLAKEFTPERQAGEIADPASTVLLAEEAGASGDVALVGYAHLVAGRAPATVQGAAPVELRRIYVSRERHGQGIAQALMDAVLDAARGRGARTIWLGVWERNPRAASFYRKYGFERVGEHTFMLGSDAQTDWIMARPLEAAPSSGAGAQ